MNKPKGLVNLLVVSVSVWVMALVWGCKESSSDAASKESAAAVNQSGRLIRASQKVNLLTPEEIERAGQTPGGQLKNEVLSRLEKESDTQTFAQALEEVIQQQGQPEGQADSAELSSRLLDLYEQEVARRQKSQEQTGVQRQEKLSQAVQLLQQALNAARSGENRETQVGPECMLGTIYMLQAREGKEQLHQQANHLQRLHGQLSQSALEISAQETIQNVYASYFPANEVKVLEARLTGGDGTDAFAAATSLRSLLAAVEQSLAERTAQKKEIQKRIDTNLQQARELHQEYLSLKEQADQAKGAAKYELEQQANSLRSGFDEFGNKVAEGEIYYEAQAEIARTEMEAVAFHLDWLGMRQKQLQESIARVEADIQALSDKTLLEATQGGINQSIEKRKEQVSRLQEGLARLEEQEKIYGSLLLETADTYRKAGQAFRNAWQAASRKTREYAGTFQKISETELLTLWQMNRQRYENALERLALLRGIQEAATVVDRLSQYCQDQAAQAQAHAQELEASLSKQGGN